MVILVALIQAILEVTIPWLTTFWNAVIYHRFSEKPLEEVS
jgi:hypothetical protein